MLSRRRFFLAPLVAAAALYGACAHGSPERKPAGDRVTSPAAPVHSEDEATAARAAYDALSARDPARPGRRQALVTYYAGEVSTALSHGHNEDAEGPFKQMLALYSAADLVGAHPVSADGEVLEIARRMEQSFRKRGAHEQVLCALAAQVALAPADAAARKRFADVTGWLEGAAGDEDAPDGAARVIDDLESIARVLPAPFVVEELARRYRAPKPAAQAQRSGKPSIRALREMMGEEHSGTRAYELARLFLRVSDPLRARKELSTLAEKASLRANDAELLRLLERINSRDGQASDWVGLSMYVVKAAQERGSDDRDVALRVCRDAETRFDKAIEPRICTGKLALSLEQLVIAMHAFEAVRTIDPSRRQVWEDLARLYQARLFQLVTEENLDVSGLPAELARVEAFHAEAQTRFPQQPLSPGLAGAVFEVGRGYYNAGHITEAERYLARSIELDPTQAALELAATVRLKRGDPQRAAVLFERAINIGHGPQEDQLYRRAKLRRLLADAMEAAGDGAVANHTRRGAVEDWDVLLDLNIPKEFASEALLERGKLLYHLGDREDGLHSLARSIDALPDRGSTYADVLAFLIPRGELAEALDAYHRALGRNEVTDYLKVYCSLWIVDLAQRAGQPEDPLALAYLRAADGGKWFDDLARWSTGRQSEAELIKHANTPGRRAEASFYRGLKAMRSGRPDEAKALWKEVLATDMMAFFEFDMAGLYVKDGPPATPRVPAAPHPKPSPRNGADPKQRSSKPAQPAETAPDGSI